MKNKQAFSLIEIVIVLLLISILISVSYQYLINTNYEVKRKRVLNDFNTITQSMIRYYIENGKWPNKIDDLLPKYIENKLDPWGHPYTIKIEGSPKKKASVGCISKKFKSQELDGIFTSTNAIIWYNVESE